MLGRRVAVGEGQGGHDRRLAPGLAAARPAEVARPGPGGRQAIQGKRGRPEPLGHRLPLPPQPAARVDHQQGLRGQGPPRAAAPERRGQEQQPHDDHHPGGDPPPRPAEEGLENNAPYDPGRRRDQVGGRYGNPRPTPPDHPGQPRRARPPSRRPGQIGGRPGGGHVAAPPADLARRPPAARPQPDPQALDPPRADRLQVPVAAASAPGPGGPPGRPRTSHGSPPAEVLPPRTRVVDSRRGRDDPCRALVRPVVFHGKHGSGVAKEGIRCDSGAAPQR